MISKTSLLLSLATTLLVIVIIVTTIIISNKIDAAVAPSTSYSDFDPFTKVYIFTINQNDMRSSTIVDGVRIWISESYFQVGDELGTDATTFEFQQQYNNATGTLVCTGRGAIFEMHYIINYAWFNTTSTVRAWRMFHWNLGAQIIYHPFTWRWWHWVAQRNSTWSAAAQYCEARTFLDNRGYLGTQTNYWEWYVAKTFSPAGSIQWLDGAAVNEPISTPTTTSDTESLFQRNWRWMSGPQKNKIFFQERCSSSSSPSNSSSCTNGDCYDFCQWSEATSSSSAINLRPNVMSCLRLDANSSWTKSEDCGSDLAASPTDGFWCAFGGFGESLTAFESGTAYATPSCGFYTTMISCRMEPRCRWLFHTSKCVIEDCTAFKTAYACRQFSEVCEWDGDLRFNNTCVKKICPETFTTPQECNSAQNCMWVDKGGIPECAERHCSAHLTPTDCYRNQVANSTGGCFWDSAFYNNTSDAETTIHGRCLDNGYAPMMSYDLFLGFHRPQSANQVYSILSSLEALRRVLLHMPMCNTANDEVGAKISMFSCTQTTGWRMFLGQYGDAGNNGPIRSSKITGTTQDGNNTYQVFTSPVPANVGDPFTGNASEVSNMIDWFEDEILTTTSTSSIWVAAPLRTLVGLFVRTTLTLQSPVRRNPLIIMFTAVDSFSDQTGLTTTIRNILINSNIKLLVARIGSNRPTVYPLCSVVPNSCSWSIAWLPNTRSNNVEYYLRNMAVVQRNGQIMVPWGSILAGGSSSGSAIAPRTGACNLYTRQRECARDDMCEWVIEEMINQNLPPQCVAAASCLSRFSDAESCNASITPRCLWSDHDNSCRRRIVPTLTQTISITHEPTLTFVDAASSVVNPAAPKPSVNGAIVGGVIGGIVGVALIVFLIYKSQSTSARSSMNPDGGNIHFEGHATTEYVAHLEI